MPLDDGARVRLVYAPVQTNLRQPYRVAGGPLFLGPGLEVCRREVRAPVRTSRPL